MADIFLSYAKEDREFARRITDALEALGWSVWWDREIPAGQTWRDVLENAVANMRCMVVLWSRNSIKSEWVKEEAEEGHTQGKLVPVLIEDVRPPMGFRAIQAADLIGWNDSREFAGFKQLIAALESALGKPGNPETATAGTKSDVGQPLRHDSAHATWQTTRKSETPVKPTRLHQWLEKLPWWSYAATTVLVTMLIASMMLSQRAGTSAKGPAVSLPVKPLDAGELTPKKIEVPAEKRPAKKIETSRVKSTPIPSGPGNNYLCAEVLARAQLGEPLSDADRDVIKKECQ